MGLTAGFFHDCTFLDPLPGIPVLRRDLRDVTPEDLIGFDAVVHLAALSNDPMGDLDPALTRDINLLASVRLAQAAKKAGVGRFVLSSSCSVYGGANGELVDENAPLLPLTPYAESKVRAEEEISKLADVSYSPIFMRNATAYGVSSRLRLDLLLNNLVGWATTTGHVRITSDGMAHRPIVHIEDISRACLALLNAPLATVHNQAFNVGVTSENYQVRQLAELVRDTIPGCEVHFAPGGSADQRDYRVDFSKLEKNLPAFHAKWNARSSAIELSEAFRLADLTRAELETGQRYVRVRKLRHLIDTRQLDSELRWAGAERSPRRPRCQLIRLAKSVVGDREIAAVTEVIRRGYLAMGAEVHAFERELQQCIGGDVEVMCVNTGTAALHLALQGCGVGPGDEVLVPTLTYIATFQAISATGATPVACDVRPETCWLDVDDCRRKITARSKAVIPVHYAGGVGESRPALRPRPAAQSSSDRGCSPGVRHLVQRALGRPRW